MVIRRRHDKIVIFSLIDSGVVGVGHGSVLCCSYMYVRNILYRFKKVSIYKRYVFWKKTHEFLEQIPYFTLDCKSLYILDLSLYLLTVHA